MRGIVPSETAKDKIVNSLLILSVVGFVLTRIFTGLSKTNLPVGAADNIGMRDTVSEVYKTMSNVSTVGGSVITNLQSNSSPLDTSSDNQEKLSSSSLSNKTAPSHNVDLVKNVTQPVKDTSTSVIGFTTTTANAVLDKTNESPGVLPPLNVNIGLNL